MYIHFNFVCDGETQKRLYPVFRKKIRDWRTTGIVSRAVLTYHFPRPPSSLYVCLDIPAVEELEMIPSSIMQFINDLSAEYNFKLEIKDYKLEIEQAKKRQEESGRAYYKGAAAEEILRFASVGTEIALQILDELERDQERWSSDAELSNFIFTRLKERLEADYEWMDWTLHFVCNPLLIPEFSIMCPMGRRVLKALRSREGTP